MDAGFLVNSLIGAKGDELPLLIQRHEHAIYELPVEEKARVCKQLHRTRQRLSSADSALASNLILSTKGAQLTRLKNLVDETDSHHDLLHLMALLPSPTRQHVLHHFGLEAEHALKQWNLDYPGVSWWPIKLYCDFDDTIQVRVFDHSFAAGTVYPGLIPLIRALRGGRQARVTSSPPAPSPTGPSAPGHVSRVPAASALTSLEVGVSDSSEVPKAAALLTGVGLPPLAEGRISVTVCDDESPELSGSPDSVTSSAESTVRDGTDKLPPSTSLPRSHEPRSPKIQNDIALGAYMHSTPGSITRRSQLNGFQAVDRSQTGAMGGDITLTTVISENPLAASSAAVSGEDRVRTTLQSFLAGAQLSETPATAVSPTEAEAETPSSSTSSTPRIDRPLADLVVLSARPAFMRTMTHKQARSLGLPMTTILCGSVASAVTSARMAAKKFENYALYHALFPEYRVVFIGDSGQADILAGLHMLAAAERNLPASPLEPPRPLILIHDICTASQQPLTSKLDRARLRARHVHVFDSYIDAAVICYEHGMLTVDDLSELIDETTIELADVRFSSTAQKLARLNEYQEGVHRAQFVVHRDRAAN